MKAPLNPADFEVNEGDLAVKSPNSQQVLFDSFKTEAIPHPDTGELIRRKDVSERYDCKLCDDCKFHGESTGCTVPDIFADDYFCEFPSKEDEWSVFNFIWVSVQTSSDEVTP